MQHAMHHQMGGMIGEFFSGHFGLGLCHAMGDGDVAGMIAGSWKGQHIGRFVFAAKIAIEAAQGPVIGQKHAKAAFQPGRAPGRFRRLFQPRLEAAMDAPVGIFDQQGDPPHGLPDDLSERL